MSNTSTIEWTEATWNPTTGCTKVSPGCAHCYIERTPAFRIAGRRFTRGHIPLQLHVDRLDHPLRWRKPRRVFVNSLSDLFHEDVPDQFIAEVFAVMNLARRHTFQVLTKRAERLWTFVQWWCGRYMPSGPPPNVWLGVSAENQRFADERIPLLLQTPAAVRFISAEPLLEEIDFGSPVLRANYYGHLDWVIVGGESGPGARPCDLSWIRNIVRQCQQADVAVFVKQLGARPDGWWTNELGPRLNRHGLKNKKGGDPAEWPADLRVREYPEMRA